MSLGLSSDATRGLSFFETRSHFASWAIVSSPLTLSMDVNDDTVMDAVWDVIANKAFFNGSQRLHSLETLMT